jgi:hypothetical protein
MLNLDVNLMKKQYLSLIRICATTLCGFSFAAFVVASPSLADPNQPFNSLDSDHTSIYDTDGSGFNPMDLILKAQQVGTNKDDQEIDDGINSAAAELNAKRKSQQKQVSGTSLIKSDDSANK